MLTINNVTISTCSKVSTTLYKVPGLEQFHGCYRAGTNVCWKDGKLTVDVHMQDDMVRLPPSVTPSVTPQPHAIATFFTHTHTPRAPVQLPVPMQGTCRF